jgi:ribonuclease R
LSKRKSVNVDPYAHREAEKYENPVPSREFIIETLERAARPVGHPELCEILRIDDEERVEAVRRRLIAMARDGQLISNRRDAFIPINKVDLIRGRVQGHRDGYGFVIRAEGGGDDIWLHGRQMRKVFDGDEVLVRLSGESYRGKDEGAIVEILARNTRQLAGRFYNEDGVLFVRPENAKVTQDIMLAYDDAGGAVPGQIVVVEITRQPDKNRPPMGRIIQVLGDHMAPGMEIELAIQSHSIPNVWPEAVLTEAAAIPVEVQESDKRNRVDLRDLPFVTIDGEDARDFDDAVLCERRRGGWRLFVAIADVSHYVAVNSELDREARLRGNSVYFPDFVVPMLPEALSNGLCSLNPDVDRLCLVCEMTISDAGRITGYQFYEAVMHSHARLTYTKVAAMLDADAPDAELRETYAHVLPQVELLHRLYGCLRAARDERGAIDFDTVETRILFNEDRKIERIVPVKRNDAHKLIEECMLCANVSAARFLEKHGIPSLYRVHEGPTEQKLTNLREFLGELGLGLSGGATPDSGDYQQLMQAIQGRADANMIQTVMLRSLRQAMYQPDNQGHFGLGYDAYTHFTSPIRRYPDLLVHRAIRSVIRSNLTSSHVRRVEGAKALPTRQIYPYSVNDILVLGEQCSLTERRADEATRDVVSWLKCEYLRDQVGEVFEGVISAVTGFGLFVELKDLYVDGLVHISALPHDYYRFEPAQHRLVGERTRKVFGLGDELVVKVVRVDLENRKIDFELESVLGNRRNKGAAKSDKSAAKAASAKPSTKAKAANRNASSAAERTARKVALKRVALEQIREAGKPVAPALKADKPAPSKTAAPASGGKGLAATKKPASKKAAPKKSNADKPVAVAKKAAKKSVAVKAAVKKAPQGKAAAPVAAKKKVVKKAVNNPVVGGKSEQPAKALRKPKAAAVQPSEAGAATKAQSRRASPAASRAKTLDKPAPKK